MASKIEELIGVKRHDSGVLIVYADEWTLALSVEQERALLNALAREAGAVEVSIDKYSRVWGHHGATGRFLVIPMEGSDE